MAELADAPALGAGGATRGSSSLPPSTHDMGKFIILAAIITIVSFGLLKYAQKKPAQDFLDHAAQKELSPGQHEFSIEHGGISRRYIVYLPISYNKANVAPVIFNFHGGGGNAESNISMANMNETADKYGFIVVYPEGTGVKIFGKTIAAWNTGTDERIVHVDDVGFIAVVIEKIKSDFNGNPARIYATGISNGAQMAYRLACELSGTIAAIAPVAAQGVTAPCNSQRPMPIMHFHGTEDMCAPYAGGICGGCIQKYFKATIGIEIKQVQFQCDPVPEYIKKWITINRIADTAPHIVYQNNSAQCIAYGKDEPGEVVLCTVDGMGHTWPGGTYGIPCEGGLDAKKCRQWISVVGKLNADISANEIMWEFFKKHDLFEKVK